MDERELEEKVARAFAAKWKVDQPGDCTGEPDKDDREFAAIAIQAMREAGMEPLQPSRETFAVREKVGMVGP